MKDFIKQKVRTLLTEQRVKLEMAVPTDIKQIKEVFHKHGFKLYLVGGCVRDAIIGKSPKDWDLATDAVSDKVIEILKGQSFVSNIIETGKQFGVVNVIVNGEEYEIATFRKDIGAGRRPDSVEFTDIDTDVKRRDLTINALFYDLDTNEVVDLVGGLEDLKNGVIRTVGSPEERFGEDRLRILRAIRFAARFGSKLDPATDAALRKDASLDGVSAERIRDEFLKGIKSAKSVPVFLDMLRTYNLFSWIFKGLKVTSSNLDRDDYVLLIAFLLQENDLKAIQSGLGKLTYTVAEIKAITFLNALVELSADTAVKLKRMQANAGVSDKQIAEAAHFLGKNPKLVDAFIGFKLSVSGEALMKTGIPAGPQLGAEIERLEKFVFLATIAG